MQATGINADNGRALSGVAHVRQSIRDILTTPVGSRVMRRDYGSQLPELVDQPMNPATLLRLAAASYLALMRWEPRLQVTSIAVLPDAANQGRLTIDLQGSYITASGNTQQVAITLPLTRA